MYLYILHGLLVSRPLNIDLANEKPCLHTLDFFGILM